MKTTKKLWAAALAVAMLGSLAACGNGGDTGSGDEAELTYAVEAGSAGEEIAEANGYKYTPVPSQADALMEVNSGNSDAAIIDLLMAGAMIGEGTSYPNLTYTESLTEEEYGVGCRQDSDLADFINVVFAEAYADGTMASLADTYQIPADRLIEQGEVTEFTPTEGGDVAYIQEKARWWWVSPSSPPWIIRTKTASGSALTPTWPSWWPKSWVSTWSSRSSTGI